MALLLLLLLGLQQLSFTSSIFHRLQCLRASNLSLGPPLDSLKLGR